MSKTFLLGGVHPDDNKISRDAKIEEYPLPEVAYLTMSQHLGAPAQPVVEKGQYVKVGELIGKAAGFISANIHSPYSGTVKKIEPMTDLAGNRVTTVVLDVQGDEWLETIDRTPDLVKDITLDNAAIIARIAECGVVGLGGATFPTNVKLAPPPGKKAEVLIINGAECEPYLTSDYRVMLEMPGELLVGTSIIRKVLGVDKAYIAIEDNKPEAISRLKVLSADYEGIEIVPLKKKYPQGGEKQLINAVTGRSVPSKGLPIDVGAVVQNVMTAVSVYYAVQKNRPLIDNVITVTGKSLEHQRNFRIRPGVKISDVIAYAGGVPEKCVKVISGGPMMGKAVANLDAALVKGSSSVLFLDEADTVRKPESNCIRCSKCVQACPMGLEPYLLNKLGRLSRYDDLEAERVYDCIECGCCSYTCPANIPLLDTIRVSKAAVMKIIKSRPKK